MVVVRMVGLAVAMDVGRWVLGRICAATAMDVGQQVRDWKGRVMGDGVTLAAVAMEVGCTLKRDGAMLLGFAVG